MVEKGDTIYIMYDNSDYYGPLFISAFVEYEDALNWIETQVGSYEYSYYYIESIELI